MRELQPIIDPKAHGIFRILVIFDLSAVLAARKAKRLSDLKFASSRHGLRHAANLQRHANGGATKGA